MSQLDDLNQAVDQLDQSVKDLAARVEAPPDLTPVISHLAAVKNEVDTIAPAA